MMIVMKAGATEAEIQSVIHRIESVGARAHPSRGEEVTVIGAIGDREHVARLGLEGAPGVAQVVPILKPYKLASTQVRAGERTVIDVEGRKIGGEHFSLIAGPCTVESRDQTLTTARAVRDAGASLFRGGAYKPRTSPYAFQGLGQEGLRLLAEAKEETGLPIVTEVMDARDIEAVAAIADVIQIGARNMQNYTLLSEIGRAGKPVLIKRGLSSTLEELLMAAEYVLKEGNPNVLLCERGIRTFETAYRFTLDLTAIPVLKELTHLPVIVDPSHAAGRRALVRRCRWRPPPRAPTGSSSRCTRTRRRRSATARSSSTPTASPSTPSRSSAPRRSPAKSCRRSDGERPAPACGGRGRRGPDRRLDRPRRARAPRCARARLRPGRRRARPRARGRRLTDACDSAPRRSTAPTSRSSRRRSARCPPRSGRARRGGAGLRGVRRGLDEAVGRRRGRRPALHRRPSAGGR